MRMLATAAAEPPRRWRTTATAGELRNPGPGPIALFVAIVTVLSCLCLRSIVPLGVIPLTAAVLLYRRTRRRRWVEHDAQREAITALCTALRAELEAGLQPRAAFISAVWSRPELKDLADHASQPDLLVDVPTLLAQHAIRPGRRALRALAACWYAADRHGVALADAVGGIEEGLRGESARLRTVEVELAGIRATIMLLAALPLFGLALGLALGANPLGTLLHRTYGEIAFILGVGLDLSGLLWTDRLVASLRVDKEPA